MTNRELKQKYPMCWSVAYKDARYAQRHQFRFVDDREVILSYIKNQQYELLDYMENFYWLLKETDRRCERDLFNNRTPVSIERYTNSGDDE